MLDGLTIVDRTTEIAGPYCSKLLADAGADVVRVEPSEGDPLRGWRSGGLFEYLSAWKRSVTAGEDAELIAAADAVITNRREDIAALRAAHPDLVVVSITPFGCDGPYVDLPATEFTLQAMCGSTGGRGLPERPPLAPGGRLGEWVTGSYAAVATAAALRLGRGEHVDIAMLDCMAVTMATYPSVFASFTGWPEMRGTGRSIEVPSIEPTSDGFVVFTTNSAQQFQDFLLMIERPDLLDDPELPIAMHRFRRRAEFLEAVHEWTTKRTSAETLEAAGMLRIPSGPVLNGETVTSFEHFIERGVFETANGLRRPRVPYRITTTEGRPTSPSPNPALPLDGIRILDCTAWWAGPSSTHVLACLGADVIKVESVTRPDLMRFTTTRPGSAEKWWEWGALFHAVNVDKRGVTIDLTRPEGVELFEGLVGTADVVVENYTPRVMEQFGLGWDRLHEVNPDLIMVRMPAFGLDGPWRERTGFAQTMESVTGMAWLTGFEDGPPLLVRGACDPIAGLHAVFATLLALRGRERDGGGRLVESVMVEAALNVAAEQVIEFDRTGTVLAREGNRGHGAAPQGVYPCAGDDRWIAIGVATDEQWKAFCGAAGWDDDGSLGTIEGRRARHDELDERISAWTGERAPEDLAAQLLKVGVPSAVVIPGRDVAHNEQLRHRGLFEVEDHAVTGEHEIPMLPFRFSSVDRWLRRPSPTLGEHNDEVLGEIATADELASLRAAGVIGETLAQS
jgi:crotonobetainyl-CoA:carnitine CoA-transferase CaiB-like acyl-CoA transferase